MLRRSTVIACVASLTWLIPLAAIAQTEKPTHSAESAKLLKSDPLHVFSESVQQLSSTVTKSVVQVLTIGFGLSTDENKDDTGYLEAQRGIGAGVVLSADGYIVTNAHVIEGARQIHIRLQGLDQQNPNKTKTAVHGAMEAKLVGVDRLTDLAVLKIDASDLPALQLADSNDLKQGQVVFAFGSPMGLENSVSMGVVSATGRQIDPTKPDIYIQTDAPINPGNSGGPLVDVDGHVVGINTFILSESGGNEGLGFAIPGGIVRFAYEEIRKYGRVRRRAIGADLQSLTPELAGGLGLSTDVGAIVSDVAPGGPADRAGLKTGDVIVSLDGFPVNNVPLFTLGLYVLNSGGSAKLEIVRGTKKFEVDVAVVEPRSDPQRLSEMAEPAKGLIARLGIVGITVTPEVAEFLGGLRMPSGAAVASLVSDQLAVDSGLAEGDVIHTLNRARITTVDDLRAAFTSLKPGEPAAMLVERAGKFTYLTFEME